MLSYMIRQDVSEAFIVKQQMIHPLIQFLFELLYLNFEHIDVIFIFLFFFNICFFFVSISQALNFLKTLNFFYELLLIYFKGLDTKAISCHTRFSLITFCNIFYIHIIISFEFIITDMFVKNKHVVGKCYTVFIYYSTVF